MIPSYPEFRYNCRDWRCGAAKDGNNSASRRAEIGSLQQAVGFGAAGDDRG